MNQNKVILEIRPGTGGDEAKLWASELLRMYTRFANAKGWKVTEVDEHVISLDGLSAYSALQNEAGVHRVQRIPKTERKGRIHTSTATVVALPNVDEKEIYINPGDVVWDFYRASSHGGQNVQKVSSAVRLKHIPSGIVVTSQKERFQERNRELALGFLRAKLWEKQEAEKERTVAGYRSVIGRGFRSEKIRTYNFPQDRLTDHRINKSWRHLDGILDGDLQNVLTATLLK
jgi:peptide chain release factor 1